jgi:dihydroorotase
MNILLKSAKIVDSKNPGLHLKVRDILVKNGTIEKIAAKIEAGPRTKVVSFKNLHVSKGWLDSSVSFGEPGFEERETITNGLKVAGKSGFTDIILNPNTYPIPDNSGAIIFLKNAGKAETTKLHPLGSLTIKGEGIELAELFDMKNAGAVAFYDFKHPIMNANLLKIALQYVHNFDALVMSFPMNTQIASNGGVHEGNISTKLGLQGIPSLAEEIQIARDLFILEYTGGKLHIPTISTANSVQLIGEAKKKGLDVTCSVALHNLWFSDTILENFESNYKVLPPIRSKKDREALKKGIKTGIIDLVTSDHVPIDVEEKRVEFDNAAYGSLGLENAFGVLNELFDTETAIELLTKGRERFNIDTHELKEGAKANLTLFDPNVPYTFEANHILSTSKNSMYVGEKLNGKVYGTIAKNTLLTS